MSKELIQAGAATLDPANDEHWTAEGLPRIEALEAATGLKGLYRADVTDALPGLTRESAPPPGESKIDPEEVAKITEGAGSPEEAELKLAQAAYDKAQAVLQQALQARDAARAKVDALREEAAGHITTNAQNIRRYLDSQVKTRLERQQNAERLAQAGLNGFQELLPKRAPIDAAMNRQNTRGRARPAF
jgi:hypothetical protein